ncbi:YciI family protein [soil metagenome]
MRYAILCYNDEAAVGAWTKAEDDACMERLHAVQEPLKARGVLGPVARLLPTTAATTLRKGREALVLDGPFAETKEHLLGFYVVDVDSLEAALAIAKDLAVANPGIGAYELRPIGFFDPGAPEPATAP